MSVYARPQAICFPLRPTLRGCAALALVAWLAVPPSAQAQADPCAGTLTPSAIVGCLRPDAMTAGTRGIRPAGPGTPAAIPASPAVPGRKPAAAVDAGPSVNLTVTFGFDSAELTPEGSAALASLAAALKDPALADGRFLIAGHTDGAGSADHNRGLSERRAAVARRFLVEQGGVEPGRLSALGFGATRLYDGANPLSPANRRVQVSRL